MPEVAAIASVLALGNAVVQGEQTRKRSKKGLRRQKEAENRATANALKAERDAERERNRAAAKTPDLGVLLEENEPRTGRLGIDQSRLLVGNRFLGR